MTAAPRVRRDTAAGVAAVLAVALVMLGPHVLAGGFHADDWVDAGRYSLHPGSGFWAAVRNHQVPSRDAYAVLGTALFAVFGMATGWHLALVAAVGAAAACLCLLLARRLGMAGGPAAAIALLILLAPGADSTRLWSNGVQMALFAGLLPVAGVLVALRGVDAGGRRGAALHAAALLLYAVSIDGYELAAPVILLAGVLYVRLVGGRATWLRWAADAVAVVALLVLQGVRRHSGVHPLADDLRHLGIVLHDGLGVAARSLVPVASAPQAPILSAAAALALLALAASVLPRVPAPLRGDLRAGLVLLGAGLTIAVAGWLMIVPADLGYDPASSGVGNRIDAVAVMGLAVAVVGLLTLVAAAARALPALRALSLPLLTAVLAIPVVIGDALAFHADARSWDRAASENRALLSRVEALVPAPAPGTMIFTFGTSGYASPSVPIFGGGGNNDLLGAVHVAYGTMAVGGFPVLSGMSFACDAASMRLLDTGDPSTAPYGLALLVDVPSGRVMVPRDRDSCVADTTALKPYAPVNESD